MVTGPPGGTYARFGDDIAAMVKDVLGGRIRIDVRPSRGGLQNICRIASQENAAFGLVYADTLRFLKHWGTSETAAMASKLRLVFPLYESEVHVFAQKRIRTLQALQRERVLVNARGSSSWITTHNLLHLLDLPLDQLVEKSLEEGITEVLNNTAAALFFVGGKPVPAFQQLAERQQRDPELAAKVRQVHFVPIDDDRLLRQREYIPATLGPKDTTGADEYPWLSGPSKIPTVSTKTVLVSFAFSQTAHAYAARRCEALREVTRAVREAVQPLKTAGTPGRWHKKWLEVDLGESVSIWPQDEACTARVRTPPSAREAFIVQTIQHYTPRLLPK